MKNLLEIPILKEKKVKHSLIYGAVLGAVAAISPIPFDFYIFSAIVIPLAVWNFSKKLKSLSLEQGIIIAIIVFVLYLIVALVVKLLLTIASSGLLLGGIINTLTNAPLGAIFATLVGLVSGAIFQKKETDATNSTK